MNIEWIIISVVLVCAVGYAVWRIYRTLNHTQNPCDCCEGCTMKGQKQRNKDCCEKKVTEKFGCTE